jgi:predicted RNA-binding Zn-ribbon protein involved in translation (DUF1610 family)
MTVRTHAFFQFSDLEALVLACPRCGSEVALRMHDPERRQAFTPSECPACKERFNVPAENLDRFRQLCREFSHLGQLSIRVKTDN